MRGKWRLMCILDFFNMKTLLQLLLAQKLISSKCVLFKNNLLQGDTVPLSNKLKTIDDKTLFFCELFLLPFATSQILKKKTESKIFLLSDLKKNFHVILHVLHVIIACKFRD